MALKATIYKAELNISDLDRGYYAEHNLTLALHPSETEERLMVRLVAFMLFAEERLEFGKGLSTTDEPALWHRAYNGTIDLWIEVGLPDERMLRKAAGRAAQVVVLSYGGKAVDVWWEREKSALARLTNLRVLALDAEQCAALSALAVRSMQLQCTIQDGQTWITNGVTTVAISPRILKPPRD